MSKVYAFTNENVNSYQELYNFSNSKVLTVLGSGDQYFASVLFGASIIDVYDIEKTAWDYFLLKFYGFLTLHYDDFFDYFVTKETNDLKVFNHLKRFLPLKINERLSKIVATRGSLCHMLEYADMNTPLYDDGRFNPYFSKENFYKLKSLLERVNIPKFYHTDLVTLADKLQGEYYDILLASNIFYWIYSYDEHKKVAEFKAMLEKFNCPEIQALYCWPLNPDLEKELIKHNFEITNVPSGNRLSWNEDSVISLRRKITPIVIDSHKQEPTTFSLF